MAEQQSFSIGETVKALRKDFPEVTVSKIRFLEAKGMILPSRTQGGYRRFDRTDVAGFDTSWDSSVNISFPSR